MAIISKIESALQQINDASFQELCNRYLYHKYNPNSITPIGSVIGKEKARKGTPDTFFVNNDGKFTFIEYTTQKQSDNPKSFFSKIKRDIYKCFDGNKTNILAEDISKVVICHTGKLPAAEIKELTKVCTGKNSICKFEQYGISDIAYGLIGYPGLLKEYLDIDIGSEQLLEVSEFIAGYEKPDLKLATPLSNLFLGRNKELENGLQILDSNSILIVNGASGTGKSRYALEVCRRFLSNNHSYKLLCVSNKGIPIYEDLQTQLNKTQDYLFLIDDANRIVANFNSILYLIKENRKGKVKLVITVRDYAAPLINALVAEFTSQQVLLESLSDDDIAAILKSSSFNINNHFFIEKIQKISRGNARIAVMCAIIANKEQTLDALNDVSQLYELYFKDAFDKITEIDEINALKVLGLISFFRTISKDHEDTNKKIFSIFKIDEDTFWEICYKLNQKEFVDLFNNQVVKISDQILSTYIFYKVYFESSILDFGLLVKHFIEFESNFFDSINPLLIAYDYKNIREKLNSIITTYWPTLITGASVEEVMKVIKIFWFCCETHSLSYIKKYVDSLPQPDEICYSFEYDQNHISFRATNTNILTLLAEFRHSEPAHIKMSFELMVLYIRKNPQEAGLFAYLMKEKYLFKRTNHLYGDTLQHTLIDFLIENIQKDGVDSIYIKIFFDVSANLLKIHFTDTESSGNNFYIINFSLYPTDSIKKLRHKIWTQVWNLYPTHKDSVYTVLSSVNFPENEDEDYVWRYDAEIILPLLIENLDYNDFRACEAAHYYFDILDERKIIGYDKRLKRKATNRLFRLFRLFSREYRVDWRKDNEIRREKLNRYCQDFDFTKYIKLFDDLTTIKNVKKGHFDYESHISQIIADIAPKDINLFLELLGYAIVNYQFSYQPYQILNSYFKEMPDNYQPIFDCLETNAKDKPYWLFAFHACIPENLIKDNYQKLIDHFFAIVKSETQFWSLNHILDKYSNYLPAEELYSRTVSILDQQSEIDPSSSFYIDAEFFEKAFPYCKDIFDQYCHLYYTCKKSERHYDYDNSVLRQIISFKPDEIVNFFKYVYGKATSRYDFDKERMNFVWELENYEEILMLCIDYFMQLQYLWCKEDAISVLFTDLGNNTEKAHLFIRKMINNYYDNKDYIYMIFLVIASCLGKYKCEYIQQYLSLNPNFETFKKLQLFPMHRLYAGSRIPYIKREIESWQEIIATVKELSPAINYLEHIEYLESHIGYCQRDIEHEAKREFQDRYNS